MGHVASVRKHRTIPPRVIEEVQSMSRDALHAGSNVALTATISIVRQRGEATGVSADGWACGGVVDGVPVALERRRPLTGARTRTCVVVLYMSCSL